MSSDSAGDAGLSRVPGAKAFVVHRGKLLFLKREHGPGAGHWNLPGGAIEPGETPDLAIRRELTEEICIAPADITYLGWHRHADGTEVHRHLVRLTDAEAAALRPGNEEQEFRFHAVDEIAQLPTSQRLKAFLQSILDPLRALVGGGPVPPPEALRLDRPRG